MNTFFDAGFLFSANLQNTITLDDIFFQNWKNNFSANLCKKSPTLMTGFLSNGIKWQDRKASIVWVSKKPGYNF